MIRKYKAAEEHLSCDLNGEAVILNMKNGKYYSVNAVGSSIWGAIQNPASFEDILSAIMQEYVVDKATCQEEIKSFLEQLMGQDLVDILDEKTS